MIGEGEGSTWVPSFLFFQIFRAVLSFDWELSVGPYGGGDRSLVVFTWSPSPFISQNAAKIGSSYLNCWKFIRLLFPRQEGKHSIQDDWEGFPSYFAVLAIMLKRHWKQCRTKTTVKLIDWFQQAGRAIVSWASTSYYTGSNFLLFHLPNSFILMPFLHGNIKNALQKI